METTILRNGTEEATPLVVGTMLSLRHLLETDGLAFYELVQVCKNPSHKPWGITEDTLTNLALMSDGTVHDSIRNIVLCAVEGDGLDMTLTSPVKP